MDTIRKDARGFPFSTMNFKSLDSRLLNPEPMHYDISTLDFLIETMYSDHMSVLIDVSYCKQSYNSIQWLGG